MPFDTRPAGGGGSGTAGLTLIGSDTGDGIKTALSVAGLADKEYLVLARVEQSVAGSLTVVVNNDVGVQYSYIKIETQGTSLVARLANQTSILVRTTGSGRKWAISFILKRSVNGISIQNLSDYETDGLVTGTAVQDMINGTYFGSTTPSQIDLRLSAGAFNSASELLVYEIA